MENLNFENNENELDQNQVNADQTNPNDGTYASDGPVSESAAEGEDELSDLDEQTDGSDADLDETTEDENAEDQMAGSDADYNDTSVTTEDLGALIDDESETAADDEEIDFESESNDESEEKDNNY